MKPRQIEEALRAVPAIPSHAIFRSPLTGLLDLDVQQTNRRLRAQRTREEVPAKFEKWLRERSDQIIDECTEKHGVETTLRALIPEGDKV